MRSLTICSNIQSGYYSLSVHLATLVSSSSLSYPAFAIHLQWAKARAAGQPQQIKFGDFWKRRLRRLYPPYLITLALFLGITAAPAGIDVTHFFVYDVVMHILMLHNLDDHAVVVVQGRMAAAYA
jgi:hypothetical protein